MKILYCIQNDLVEDVLKRKRLINKNSLIIRNKKELTFNKVRKIDPDFIMFPHWSYLVPEKIVNDFKCICFHSSPLPYGRGGSPIQNMIKNGFSETEVCSLLMKKELDTGPVYLRTKIDLSGTLDEILIRAYEAIAQQIKILKSTKIIPKPQEEASFNFQRLSLKDNSIDFHKDLKNIYDQIRMLDSDIYPKSYTYKDDYLLSFENAYIKNDSITANVTIKKKVSIRDIKFSDSREIWEWRNNRITREMFKTKDFIEYDDHLQWFKSKIKDKNTYFFMGTAFGINAGVVRIDVLKNYGEVSINTNPKIRGLNLSENILKQSIDLFSNNHEGIKLIANIDVKNIPSIKIFKNIGFMLEKKGKNINRYGLEIESK